MLYNVGKVDVREPLKVPGNVEILMKKPTNNDEISRGICDIMVS